MTAAEEPLGRLIGGRYRLGAVLGQGGMGVVYTATQESLTRPVALKVLQPALAQNLDAVARFRAEAERAGRLAHPHIVQILDFGREPDGAAWIAMELLSGESLASRIERGPFSEKEAVRVALETLSALEAAHGAQLVHRDLKPDNIFLADVPGIGASVKVLDFGIAKLLDGDTASKLTATGMLVGTPLYMSPEQARGEDVDARSDLYSLGCVLYEMLAGRPPVGGANYNALLFAILSEEPPPLERLRPDVSPELARVLERAIAKRASERFASARELADALRALALSGTVPPPAARTGLDAGALATAPTLAGASARDVLGSAPTMATPQPDARTPLLGGATAPAAAPASPARETPLTPAAPPPPTSASPLRTWIVAGVIATLAAVSVISLDRLLPRDPPAPPTAAPLLAAPPSTTSTTPAPIEAPIMRPMDTRPEVAATEAFPPPEPPAPSDPAIEEVVAATNEEAPEPTRPRPRPRVRQVAVSPSYIEYAGMGRRSAVEGPLQAEGGWASCWPRSEPVPESNRSRPYNITIDAEGHVVAVEPSPVFGPPAFDACVQRKIRGITFPAPVTGATVRVRVGFGIDG